VPALFVDNAGLRPVSTPHGSPYISQLMTGPEDMDAGALPGAPSDIDLEELEAEIPLLVGIREFAEEAEHLPWFSRVGRRLDGEDKALARDFLDGLGLVHAEPARLQTWQDAADAAETLGLSSEGWEIEEGLRAALTEETLTRLTEDALHFANQALADRLSRPIRAAVYTMADMWQIDDEEFLNAAVGAGLQAAHTVVLALACDAEYDHPFRRKFALFARGRWPVGIAGQSLNIF